MKTILITGANRGIGLALTELYLDQGWRVVACCRAPDSATELQTLSQTNAELSIYQLDVVNHKQVSELAAQLGQQSIDVLLNNAGYYGPKGKGFAQVDMDEWRRVIKVNTLAPYVLAEAFYPHLLKGNLKIFAAVSSRVGSHTENTKGGGYIYRSSKAALNSVVKSLSNDLLTKGIKTVSLHPGWVKTDMGGPNALISPSESAQGLKQVLDNLTDVQSGGFYSYTGEQIAW